MRILIKLSIFQMKKIQIPKFSILIHLSKLNKKIKKCNYSPDSAPIFFLVAAPLQFRAIIEAAVNALTIKNLFLVVL